MADKLKDTKKKVTETAKSFFDKIPVPVPGSSFNLIENARKKIMEALRKKKGSEGNSDK